MAAFSMKRPFNVADLMDRSWPEAATQVGKAATAGSRSGNGTFNIMLNPRTIGY
jgi:hypothetical protein